MAISAAPVREVVPTTTSTVPPTTTTTTTTTTTVPPTTTTSTFPIRLAGDEVRTNGIVTYYDHPAGYCASPWLPFGTVVRITNPANGLTVTCLVNDREADRARSIDLSTATFAQLAPLWQGVVYARLSW
jgi:rare lipoprotein A